MRAAGLHAACDDVDPVNREDPPLSWQLRLKPNDIGGAASKRECRQAGTLV